MNTTPVPVYAVALEEATDVRHFGGKNAALGELLRTLAAQGVRVPGGFATTADAYRLFVRANALEPLIRRSLDAWTAGAATLAATGETVRAAFLAARWPAELEAAIRSAYQRLGDASGGEPAVAVRSSATAEDLPDASFAGQQETFLNVRGADAVLDACRRCYASLFTDRAIAYRRQGGFDDLQLALSIGVQRMVRADVGSSGVMFTLDTETGFDRVVRINAAWGLGEPVVQGQVDPDEYMVFKPLLDEPGCLPILERRRGAKAIKMVLAEGSGGATRTEPTSAEERSRFALDEAEILQLARWACAIERHYGRPMDIEWAKDGISSALYIVQARPETVQSRHSGRTQKSYRVEKKGALLAQGVAVGESAVNGTICIVRDPHAVEKFPDGAILVAENTDPDWVPIMRKAAAIVTNHGGRTSHAAIVSRELGVPAVIGTGDATLRLRGDQRVTVSCAEGDIGHVYEGSAQIVAEEVPLQRLPATRTHVMFNLADPAAAFRWWRLPADGVGLARMEFVISNAIKIHPMALLHPERVGDEAARREIDALTQGYADRAEYFVERLASGLARLAAVYHPQPAIVRLSDFKTNEYANLIGGASFEPREENPMIGFRGASRYYSPRYREAFALECRALKRLRDTIGLRNVMVMVPFCRTPEEADRVLAEMAKYGLQRGVDGLKIYVMCEIPANVILAEDFARRFDGFSIGSNDLTQLTLGIDRDSAELAPLFDESNPAVLELIRSVVTRAHAAGVTVGFCGEAPSAHPTFAQFLVQAGIDSISINPSSFLAVKCNIAATEVQTPRERGAPGVRLAVAAGGGG
ncbi:phosphoenolpyruvate synthase [Solimonas soli]|uniref:phosphoenolpyruvate synthase n=1 Tax=Solimonas soli TaxID=413479 RepID=UPI000686DC57|nr:phosphoenolpyruvate synthase [Solimonas soli]